MTSLWTRIVAVTALLCSLVGIGATMLDCQTGARQPGAAPSAKVSPAPEQSAMDLHGDPLPQGTLARMGTLRLHESAHQVAYSSDGKVLVSSSGAEIKIWDAVSGRELNRLDVGYGAMTIALSPDGSRLAAKGPGDFACIWDMASGKELHRLPVHDQTNYPIKEVFGVAFSPDGKLLATVGFVGKFVVWDAILGKERVVLPRLGNHYCRLAFSDDGKTLISGERNRTRLWEIASGKERGQFPDQEFVAISPDGKILALVSNQRRLQLVELGTGKTLLIVKDIASDLGGIYALTFAPDGNTLAIGCREDRAVRLRDAHTGKAIRTIPLPGHVLSASFTPDGKTLAVGVGWGDSDDHHRIRLFNTATGAERMLQPSHQGTIRQLHFLSDDKTLASTSADNTFRLWQAADGKPIRAVTLGKMPLAMTQDGALIATCREDWNRPAMEETVELWDTTTSKIRYRLAGHKEGVDDAAFSPDGTILAVSVRLGDGVYLWDTQTGKLRNKWTAGKEDPQFRAKSLAFSPDGKILATGHQACVVRLREVSSGRVIRELDNVRDVSERFWFATGCFSIAFAPDGKSLAAVAAVPEHSICVWDIASGRLMCSCKPHVRHPEIHEDRLHCLAYSPDGRMLLSAGQDGMIRIWDPATGKEIRRLKGHGAYDYVSALAFSKDGTRLASGSQDCTVLIWDMSGKKRRRAAERGGVSEAARR